MTSPTACLELGAELARMHERCAPGQIAVVPVVVDDLHAATTILRALCGLAEGRFFSADDDELQGPVPGTADVVRRVAIERALAVTTLSGPRSVIIESGSAGNLDARYDPPIGAEPSRGQAAVLAIARAFAHAEFDKRDLVIVAYSENGMDRPFREAIWSLGVDHVNGLPHDAVKLLVQVAEAPLDIQMHCQAGRGVRFALDGSRLIKRHSADDLAFAVAALAKDPRPVVFFLGAGFSASSRIPLGNTTRDNALRRLLAVPDGVLSPLELGCRFHRLASDREGWLSSSERAMREDEFARQLTLEQVIRIEKRMFDPSPTLAEFRAIHDEAIKTPGSAAIDLGFVLERLVGHVVVVEVNFDQLVETCARVPVEVFASTEEFEAAPEYIRGYLDGRNSGIPLLKLHGSIERPETCIVSDDQTLTGVGRAKLQALRAIIGEAGAEEEWLWIYVGASMRDRDLLPILSLEDFARGLDERWVAPFLDRSVEDFAEARAQHWSSGKRQPMYNRLVTETADAFFAVFRQNLP